jgi:hypothetical protein
MLYGLGSVVVGVFLAYAGIATARLVPQRHHREVS